jgi:hypothetical protein
VFSVVTSLGNKPAQAKSNGTIYQGIVETHTGVQSYFLLDQGILGHKITKFPD